MEYLKKDFLTHSIMFVLSCLLLTSCFHYGKRSIPSNVRVQGTPDGNFKSVATEEDKDQAIDDAAEGAEVFCERRNKVVVALGESADYKGGLVNEKTDNLLNKGTALAGMFGGGVAEDVNEQLTGDSKYKTILNFKCQ